MSLPDSYVLVDVETTGANPVIDRVTEIAVLRVERGAIVSRGQSLVNPQRPIPPLIERLIGITDEMVSGAPTFAELAGQVRSLLDGAVFVAHNARFDYGFICNEYARLDEAFEAPVLCTVKLSRALYPDHHRHGLDALIARHGFSCEARHRAMGDVEVLWQFVRLVAGDFGGDALARACARAMKQPPRPPALPEGVVEGLPDAPGVYTFYGDDDAVLFVGRAASLRARVMEQFAAAGRRGKAAELVARVRRLEWQETAGELAALLGEAALVRALRPGTQRAPSDGDEVFGLRLIPNRRRAPILERVPLGGTDPACWDGVHGAFRSRKEADNVLRELANLYQLCPRRLGLEAGGQGACEAHRARRCAGVCAKKERAAEHDARLIGGLRSVGPKPWPWPGAVVVTERAADGELEAHHLLDRWCHLGSADDADALAALCANPPPRRFDVDIARLLQRWLAVEANREKVRTAPY
ncbi:MAG TPA: exonuclease domain-containing protein [Rhodocyclaceae bacterium]|nr:exonuclease domain-containing protein [Rhodocyclaceae bacterium]